VSGSVLDLSEARLTTLRGGGERDSADPGTGVIGTSCTSRRVGEGMIEDHVVRWGVGFDFGGGLLLIMSIIESDNDSGLGGLQGELFDGLLVFLNGLLTGIGGGSYVYSVVTTGGGTCELSVLAIVLVLIGTSELRFQRLIYQLAFKCVFLLLYWLRRWM
jgi:hypothetical protein